MPKRPLQISRIIQKRQIKIERTRHSGTASGRKAFIVLSAVLAVGITAFLIWAGAILGGAARDLPSVTLLPQLLDPTSGSLLQPTHILDRTAKIEIDQLGVSNLPRKFISVSQTLPAHYSEIFLQTVVQALQPDYWSNPGARLDAMTDPEPSTLAEHLVHDLLLWPEPESTLKALRMRILAVQVIVAYGHEQTLEWYLNSLYFGNNIMGVEEASQAFFGKSASELDLAESALLAAVANSPALNPWDAPEQAKLLQEQLLTRLYVEGKITQTDYTQTRQENLTFRKKADPAPTIFSGFTRLMLSQMEGFFPDHRLERGGLTIVTTLDVDLQEQSACVLQSRLAQLEMQPNNFTLPANTPCQAAQWLPTVSTLQSGLPKNLSGSVVIIDPQTGQLLAMVGDESLNAMGDSLLSHAPGSTLTPFVAVAAFSRGLSPSSLLWDIPSSSQTDFSGSQDPQDSFHGPLRFRTALGEDWLRPVASVQDQLGTDIVWKLAEPFGLTGLAQADSPSQLIYTGGSISPLRMAQAYAVFANLGSMQGWRIGDDPGLATVSVLNVLDSAGEPLLSSTVQTQPVLSSQLAFLVHDVLSSSQGWQSSDWQRIAPSINRPAGVKLGKTSDGHNAWAVGYTPQRVTVVWLGLPDSSGPDQVEASQAGDIWQAIMLQAHQDLPVLGWSIPQGVSVVTVCDPSGMLPTDACPQTVPEVFLNGSEPTQIDDLYQKVAINIETGRLATVYTPPTLVEQKLYMNVPSQARAWAAAAGIPLAPTEYDQIPVTTPDPTVQISQPEVFAIVSGNVEIRGTAAGDNFKSAWVEVGQGIDPVAWQKPGGTITAPVSNALLAQWDTHDLDGLYAIRLVVLHQDQTFDSTVIQVTVDNSPPVIKSLYPTPAEVISTPASGLIVLQAEGSDNIGIDRVEWWLDGTKTGERFLPPFSLPWRVVAGEHTLLVRAYDTAGNMAQTDSSIFDVK